MLVWQPCQLSRLAQHKIITWYVQYGRVRRDTATLTPVWNCDHWFKGAAVTEWWLKPRIGGLRVVVALGSDVVGVEGIVYTVICREVNTYSLRPFKRSYGEGTDQ